MNTPSNSKTTPAIETDPTNGGATTLAPPPRSLPLAMASVVLVAAISAAFWVAPLRSLNATDMTDKALTAWTIVIAVLAALTTSLLVPSLHAAILSLRSRTLDASGEIVAARHVAARAREKAQRALGFALAGLVVLLLLLFLLTNNAAIIETFFSWDQISRSAKEVAQAFWLNAWIAVVSEVFVLVLSLSLALIRVIPSRAVRPLRWLAIAYIDIFRGIPVIILLYLVAFGIPIAGIPVLSDIATEWLIVLGLTISTSAYVAEVFRSAIESVHWNQTAAAMSLGFSTPQTWRYVVVPQATRRVLPPLLSYFVGLQKETSLVLVVGAIDAFGQAKIYAGNYFNLSSVTVVAIVFVLVTIPQSRLVDHMIARQNRRTGVRQA
ncbi:MAG: amino acid ABC transporter permease [Acidimicrobiia bacterium]|jgi:polar amino acid transport system permease protein